MHKLLKNCPRGGISPVRTDPDLVILINSQEDKQKVNIKSIVMCCRRGYKCLTNKPRHAKRVLSVAVTILRNDVIFLW